MEENRTPEEIQQTVEPEGEKTKLPSFGERLLAIFVEPKVVFDYVAKRTDFWLPFLALSVLMAIANVLSLPTNNEGQTLVASATGRPAPSIDVLAYVKSTIQAPIQLLIGLLIIGVLIWVVMLITTGNAGFGKAVSVAAWTAYPGTLGMLLNAIVVAVVQPEIRSLASMIADQTPVMHYTSLDVMITGVGPVLSMILMTISIFYIWQLWLLYIGARRSFGASRTGSWVLVIVLIIFQIGFAALAGWGMSMLQRI